MRNKSVPLVTSFAFAATVSAAALLGAHDQIPGAPQRRPIVIENATIHPVDRAAIERGAVLFDQGKIKAVGASVAAPDNAQRIDATGKHVYPGLIESVSDIGLREISSVRATVDHDELGDQNFSEQTWVAVNPDSELIPVARAGGVLSAMIVPHGSGIRGQTAVMNLDGWTAAEMLVKSPAGIMVSWRSFTSRDSDAKKRAEQQQKKLKELSELFEKARRYDAARQADSTVAANLKLEGLLRLVRREVPLIAEADSRSEIESAIGFAQQENLQLILYGGYDAEQCAQQLKEYEIPVIVAGTYRLPQRRHDPYDAPYTLPARLQKAAVAFAIGGEGAGSPRGAANARNLGYHAGNAVAYGLDADIALRAITLSAAEILGVADRLGSITVGKDATLIITDGDILQTEARVEQAFIRGRAVDLGNKHETLYAKYREKYEQQTQSP